MAAAFVAVPSAAKPLAIRADSYPVAFFAERIAGDTADVVLPIPPSEDPESWTPSIADIAAYQEADLILLNGAGLAQWTTRATLPRASTIDTSAAFSDRLIFAEEVTHSHGPEGTHSHAATAALTWLDLDQARQQAEAVASALAGRRPEEAARFQENLQGLVEDLAALDAEAAEVGALAGGRHLLASQHRYQYFARRYGLDVESVSWDPTQPPATEQLAALDIRLGKHAATVMLWEDEPGPEAAEDLRTRGVTVVVFPALARPPDEGDFLTSMAASLSRLRQALAAP
jgi:zinc transport system substrate-binding protein